MCISIHLTKHFTKILFHTYKKVILTETNGIIPSGVWGVFFGGGKLLLGFESVAELNFPFPWKS